MNQYSRFYGSSSDRVIDSMVDRDGKVLHLGEGGSQELLKYHRKSTQHFFEKLGNYFDIQDLSSEKKRIQARIDTRSQQEAAIVNFFNCLRIKIDNNNSGTLLDKSKGIHIDNNKLYNLYTEIIDSIFTPTDDLKDMLSDDERLRTAFVFFQSHLRYLFLKLNILEDPNSEGFDFWETNLTDPDRALLVKITSCDNPDLRTSKEAIIFYTQKISYVVGSALMDDCIEITDTGMPIHPLELQLLSIVKGARDNSAKGYVSKKESGDALEFYQEQYYEYIASEVMYQDYLSVLDKKLFNALLNHLTKDELRKFLPSRNVRYAKEREFIKNGLPISPNKVYSLSRGSY